MKTEKQVLDVKSAVVSRSAAKSASGTRSPRRQSPSSGEKGRISEDTGQENRTTEKLGNSKMQGLEILSVRKVKRQKTKQVDSSSLDVESKIPEIVVSSPKADEKGLTKSPVVKKKTKKDLVNQSFNQDNPEKTGRKRQTSKSPNSKKRTPTENPSPTKKKVTPSNSPARGSKTTSPSRKRSTSSNSEKPSPSQEPSISPSRSSSSRLSSLSSSSSSLLNLEIPDQDSSPKSVHRVRSPNAKFKQDIIMYPWDSVKKSPKKSPLKKSHMTEPAADSAADDPEKESVEKSPESPNKKNRVKKQKSSASKTSSQKTEEKPSGSASSEQLTSRVLDFDKDVTLVEGLKMSLPNDFQYKYTLNSTNSLGLSDLISKVSSSIKETDTKLMDLFGSVEEPEFSEESPEGDSIDSDKTVIDFDSSVELAEGKDTCANDLENDDKKDGSKSQSVVEKDVKENANVNLNVQQKTLSEGEQKSSKEISQEKLDTNEAPSDDFSGEDKKSGKHESKESGTPVKENSESKPKMLSEVEESPKRITRSAAQNLDSVENNKVDKEKQNIRKKLTEDTEEQPKSIFDMYGLKLKKIGSFDSDDCCEERKTRSKGFKDEAESKRDVPKQETVLSKNEKIEVPSDLRKECVVVLDKREGEIKKHEIDSEQGSQFPCKGKSKFPIVNKIVEPKPLDILSQFEKTVTNKASAFVSKGLEQYLEVNKDSMPAGMVSEGNNCESVLNDDNLSRSKDVCLSKMLPDFDEIDEILFVSFSSATFLKAHVELERKVDWMTDTALKKMGLVKNMKERQHSAGLSRLTDVKNGEEQKQNFRGIPMRLMKYQKLLKQEVETLLDIKRKRIPEVLLQKSPEKTSDITKIKGWKNKFHTAEELQEATGLLLSESGKLHWRTEERLLKNLDPDDVKDIGLDLKKKRRKLVNYSNRKKGTAKVSSKVCEKEPVDYDTDEPRAITEKDVYNEDDDKPNSEKVPYSVRYLSQHKYGARKLFVKKMGLDATDEMILKKLGAQKLPNAKDQEEASLIPNPPKSKRSRQFVLAKLTMSMALAAVSALDKKLINKAKQLAQNPAYKRKRSGERLPLSKWDEPEDRGDDAESDENEEEFDPNDGAYDLEEDHMSESDEEAQEVTGSVEKSRKKTSGTANYKTRSRANSHCGGEGDSCMEEPVEEKVKSIKKEVCDEPGCRYGCICHLCKLSDSGEEKEAEVKPPCDKEYCRLGCICESVDTQVEVRPHCRKPCCIHGCKCPPKQPKPDIPRERDGHEKKKKKGKGSKKKKRSPEKDDDVASDKEGSVMKEDTDDWEPPIKRKRNVSNNRFANLPRRETTYRVAKNLDAVSRKAMEVYVSSEMYAEQRIRRRRSDPWSEQTTDDTLSQTSSGSKPSQDSIRDVMEESLRVKNEGGSCVLEISDDSEEEMFPDDLVSCSRTLPYSGTYKSRSCELPSDSRPGSPALSSRKSTPTNVIDLVDSDDEKPPSSVVLDRPSTSTRSHDSASRETVSQKLGLTKGKLQANIKWKTQMVCLKAKKKSDDKTVRPQSEIKLLEIISNCAWESDRTNMLSKISQIISKDYPVNHVTMWGNYVLQFLPQADKPAVIPPELQSKLPNSMYSIRVRVTQCISDIEKAENGAKEDAGEPEEKEEEEEDEKEDFKKLKEMTEEEKKKYVWTQQKKLIDKIKFAERLRDLIIAEEKKGTPTEKFSVSREGIEKALKRYKTQLWKAYTGTNNLSLQQLRQAVQAAKVGRDSHEKGKSSFKMESQVKAPMSNATMARIQTNQGLKVVYTHSSTHVTPTQNAFIPLHQSPAHVLTAQPLAQLPVCSVSQVPVTIQTSLNNFNVNNVLSTTIAQSSSCAGTMPSTVRPAPVLAPSQTVVSTMNLRNQALAFPAQTAVTTPSTANPKKFTTDVPVPHLAGSEVLLIPVPDGGNGKWDPNSNPVLAAKLTMLPKSETGNPVPSSSLTSNGVHESVSLAQGKGMRMPILQRATLSSKPVLNQPITVFASGQGLNGKQFLLQPNKSGSSQLMINAIQPVSSSSPVYNHVQGMRFCSMPVNSTSYQTPVTSSRVDSSIPVSMKLSNLPSSTQSLPGLSTNNPVNMIQSSSIAGRPLSFPVMQAVNPLVSSAAPVAFSTTPIRYAVPPNLVSLSTNHPVMSTSMPGISAPAKGLDPKSIPHPVHMTAHVTSVDGKSMIQLLPLTSPLLTSRTMQTNMIGQSIPSTGAGVQAAAKPCPQRKIRPKKKEKCQVEGDNIEIEQKDCKVEQKDNKIDQKEMDKGIASGDSVDAEQVKSSDGNSSESVLSMDVEKIDKDAVGLLNTDSDSNGGADSFGSSLKSFSSLGDIVDLTEEKLEGGSISDRTVVLAEKFTEDFLNTCSKELEETCESKAAKQEKKIDSKTVKRSDGGLGITIGGSLGTLGITSVNSSQIQDSGKTGQGSGSLSEDRKRKCLDNGAELTVKKFKQTSGSQEKQLVPRDCESEESDVDIMSLDPDGSDQRVGASRRKSTLVSHSNSMDDDIELHQIKKVMNKKAKDRSQGRINKERIRRVELRGLFKHLANIVFKYRPEMLQKFPDMTKNAILLETRQLLAVLKEKQDALKECLHDGLQYQAQLREELARLKKSFFKSGLPEAVVNNFLKSVANASGPAPKVVKTTDGTCLQEDDDAFLDSLSTTSEYLCKSNSLGTQESQPSKLEPEIYIDKAEDEGSGTDCEEIPTGSKIFCDSLTPEMCSQSKTPYTLDDDAADNERPGMVHDVT